MYSRRLPERKRRCCPCNLKRYVKVPLVQIYQVDAATCATKPQCLFCTILKAVLGDEVPHTSHLRLGRRRNYPSICPGIQGQGIDGTTREVNEAPVCGRVLWIAVRMDIEDGVELLHNYYSLAHWHVRLAASSLTCCLLTLGASFVHDVLFMNRVGLRGTPKSREESLPLIARLCRRGTLWYWGRAACPHFGRVRAPGHLPAVSPGPLARWLCLQSIASMKPWVARQDIDGFMHLAATSPSRNVLSLGP